MHAFTILLLLVVALVGTGVVALVMRKAGCPCQFCGRKHAWTAYGPSGLRYLMPRGDAPVLPRCNDHSFGTALQF